jgi:hypothetical protein
MVYSTFTNVIAATTPSGFIGSTVSVIGTLSTVNEVTSSLTSFSILTSNFSSFFYGGIEKYNYISTVSLQS